MKTYTQSEIVEIIRHEPNPDKVISAMAVFIEQQKQDIADIKEVMKELYGQYKILEGIAFANERLPGPDPVEYRVKKILEASVS